MNERIKQLMDQAHFDVEALEDIGEMPNALKFAELIVKECMRVVGNPTCPNYAYQAIQKHFGVEE